MGRPKTGEALTPAEKQRCHRERRAAAQAQDSEIAAAARILHEQMLLSQGATFKIPEGVFMKDTATFMQYIASEIESSRIRRTRK